MNFAEIGRNINLTELLLAHLDRRLRSALRRFGKKIRHTAVQLAAFTGVRSGFYSQCKVTACLSPGGKVIVQETGADFHSVINRALDRLERSVRLKLNRMTRLEKRKRNLH